MHAFFFFFLHKLHEGCLFSEKVAALQCGGSAEQISICSDAVGEALLFHRPALPAMVPVINVLYRSVSSDVVRMENMDRLLLLSAVNSVCVHL